MGAFSPTGASPVPPLLPPTSSVRPSPGAGHDREVLAVHRRRRRLRVDLAVAHRARAAARTGPARRAGPPARPPTTSAGTSAPGWTSAIVRCDVVAAPLGLVGHQRLAVDEQPHPPDVDLGERQHDLRGEQPSGRARRGRRFGSGRRQRPRPGSPRRSTGAGPRSGSSETAAPCERRWTARRAAGRSPARPAPWRARSARSARRRRRAAAWGRRTRCARCGSRPGRSTAARRRRPAAGRSATARRGAGRRRPTGTATARARTPRPGEPPDRGAADADRGGARWPSPGRPARARCRSGRRAR